MFSVEIKSIELDSLLLISYNDYQFGSTVYTKVFVTPTSVISTHKQDQPQMYHNSAAFSVIIQHM